MRIPFATPPLLDRVSFGSASSEAMDFVQIPDHEIPDGVHPLSQEIIEEFRPQHGEPPHPRRFQIHDIISEGILS